MSFQNLFIQNHLYTNKGFKVLSLFYCVLFVFFSQNVLAQTQKDCDSLIKLSISKIFEERNYREAIQLLRFTQKVSKEKQFSDAYFLSTNNLGAAYFQMLDYASAIQMYTDAYNSAVANNSTLNMMTALNNIAIVYVKDDNFEKAKNYFLRSFNIAVKEGKRAGISGSNLAEIYLKEGNIEKSKGFINKVFSFPDNNSKVELSLQLLTNKILLAENKYSSVINNCKQLLANSTSLKITPDHRAEINLLLVEAFIKNEDWEEAKELIRKELGKSHNKEVVLRFYELNSILALKTENIVAMFAIKDSLMKISSSIQKNKNQNLIDKSKLQFELALSEHDLKSNIEKTNQAKRNYLIVIFLIAIIFILIAFSLYKNNQLIKHKQVAAQHKLATASLELKNSVQKQAGLEEEISNSNHKLYQKIVFQTTRNELIQDLIKTVTNSSEVIKSSEVKKLIHSLKKHLREDEQWEDFMSHFENINVSFLKKLRYKHPDLNSNDIRFLSFVFLNMNNKEIARLMGIAPVSVRKRKERVVKKLKIPKDLSLEEYLSLL